MCKQVSFTLVHFGNRLETEFALMPDMRYSDWFILLTKWKLT